MHIHLVILAVSALLFPWTFSVADANSDSATYRACDEIRFGESSLEKVTECISALAKELSIESCETLDFTVSTGAATTKCSGLVIAELREINEEQMTGGNVSTLVRVTDRKKLICGVSEYNGGFSDFEKDLCRVVAITVFGDLNDRITFNVVSPKTKYSALKEGHADVVFASTTWNSYRDADEGKAVDFGPVYFHDGQKFLVKAESGFSEVSDLANRLICVRGETTTKTNLVSVFEQLGKKLKFDDSSENYEDLRLALESEADGSCEAITGDESALLVNKFRMIEPDKYEIISDDDGDPISYEPLAAMVAENDSQWREIVSYAVWATMWAEQEGINRKNPRSFAKSTWEALGVNENAGELIVRALGNYGEIFDRNLSRMIPAGGRGRNQLSKLHQDGWLIVPPMEAATVDVTETMTTEFGSNSSELSVVAEDEIAKFVSRLISSFDEIISVSVFGHTDDIGGDKLNKVLSENRASVVSNEFVKEFPDAEYHIEGVGASQPIANNATPNGRRANRRVVVDVKAR